MSAPRILSPTTTSGGTPVGGSGTPGTIPVWSTGTTLGDSIVKQTGSNLGVNLGANPAISRLQLLVPNSGGVPTSADWMATFSADALYRSGFGFQFAAGVAANNRLVCFVSNGTTTGQTAAWTADGSGNVGIGTASPSSLGTNYTTLDIRGSAGGGIRMGTPSIMSYMYADSSGYNLATSTALPIILYTNNAERARIDSAGRMCIGTTTATTGRALTTVADLDVFGVRVGRGGGDVATNVALGPGVLTSTNAASARNTAIGDNAMASASMAGADNVAVGHRALVSMAAGFRNVAMGANAAELIGASSDNVAIGSVALYNLSTAAQNGNVAIGSDAARYRGSGTDTLTASVDSIFIGRSARANANSETNQIVIGATAVGNGSNTVTIGNSSNVGTFLDTKYVRIVDSYTVATLPAAGTAGRIARVTDGDAALAWGATVVNTGAGATPYLVWDNGTNWTVFGK